MTDTSLRTAAERLDRAMTNPGRRPDYHYAVLRKIAETAPEIHAAICEIQAELRKDTP